jgi:amino-acid N-acetyltransferase
MEDVATSTAIAIKADKLIFLTEIAGVHQDLNDKNSAIDTELPLEQARSYVAELPAPTHPTEVAFYLRHCIRACEAGVERSHILPFAVDGAILLEIYTHDGIGTMVVDEKLESVREATNDDVSAILSLIEPFENDGTLVKRSRSEIERDAGNYTIIEHDGVIFGCAALYPFMSERMGEMAALTVSPQAQEQGDGERLLKRVEQRARQMGLEHLFVLTTRTMHWFIKRGFVEVQPEQLPLQRRETYNWDRRSKVLMKKL